METGLAGKVVLVTGATRNHGRASALAFAAEGAHLLLCTRQSMALLEETAHLAAPCGVKIVTGQCDVTNEAQVRDFVQRGLAEFGRIDVVVNNAGWRARGDFLSISTENWLAAIDVNLHAPFLVSQAVLPSMVEHRWGRIINYSGIGAYRGSTRSSAKMANEGLTRAIAREYGKYNITANLIAPGSIEVIRTPGQEMPGGEGAGVEKIPIPRQGTVDECTALVVFLAGEPASYITGQTYLVNGGAYFL
jgi:3-oxoacyl-[acyl-carrier protein] reductase